MLVLSMQAFSQDAEATPEAVTEHGLWTSLDIQKKWDNGLALGIEEECRLRDNYMSTDRFMSTVDLSYKPLSFLKAGASYTRISYNHPGKKSTDYMNYWELRNRYSFYLQGQYSFHRFDLSLKERYQNTYRLGVAETDTRANPKEVLRSKLALSYDVKGFSLEPYASCEWMHSLNDPTGNNGLVEMRYAVGLKYDFKEGISVECGYLYDMDKDPENPINTHVFTFGVAYSF
jgi:predicted porin